MTTTTEGKTMTTINNHSLAEAFAARRRELEAELSRIDKAMAILGPGEQARDARDVVPGRLQQMRAGLIGPVHRHPTTMRDWIARIATQQGTVTRDAVIEAAAKRGRRYSQSSVACELSQMKREGLLRKVFKGYQAASQ